MSEKERDIKQPVDPSHPELELRDEKGFYGSAEVVTRARTDLESLAHKLFEAGDRNSQDLLVRIIKELEVVDKVLRDAAQKGGYGYYKKDQG